MWGLNMDISFTNGKRKFDIGLFKMFSLWILGTFNTSNQSEIGWELMWVKYETQNEDLLVKCVQI